MSFDGRCGDGAMDLGIPCVGKGLEEVRQWESGLRQRSHDAVGLLSSGVHIIWGRKLK